MADLSELQSSETVKIVGSDSSGLETHAVGSTADGELKVSARLIDAVHNTPTAFGAFGHLKTAQETIIADFRYDINSIQDLFDIKTSASSRYEIVDGLTGVSLIADASNSKIEMYSKNNFFYQAGRGLMVKESAILGDTGTVGAIREWGIKDGNNGIFWRFSDSTLSIVILKNGVETEITSNNWDTPVTPDQYGHLYYIQGQFLYVGNIYFYYDGQLVHTYNFLGTSTDFSIGTADLKKYYKCENIANNSTIYLKAGCSSIITEGNPNALTIGQAPRENDLAVLNKTILFGKNGDSYNDVQVNKQGQLKVENDVLMFALLTEIVNELKKTNMHLRELTDIDLEDEELEY